MDLLTIAKQIADRAEAESIKQEVPVAVTVIDTHGNVVLTHRMPGAPAFSLELAERKAYTSALVGISTADLVPARATGRSPLSPARGLRRSILGDGWRRAGHQRRPGDRRGRRQRRDDGTGHRDRRSRYVTVRAVIVSWCGSSRGSHVAWSLRSAGR